MRYAAFVIVPIAFFSAATPNFAQSAAEDIDSSGALRCFYASRSFALESPLLIGNMKYVCGSAAGQPKWVKADQSLTVNCLYNSGFYSPGSIESATSLKIAIVCKDDGTWEKLAQ